MSINEILSGVETLKGKKKGERKKMVNAIKAIAEMFGATAHIVEHQPRGEAIISIEHDSGLTTSCMVSPPTRGSRGEWLCMSWTVRRGGDQCPIYLSRRLRSESPHTGYLPESTKCTVITDGFGKWCKELARGLALAERGQATKVKT